MRPTSFWVIVSICAVFLLSAGTVNERMREPDAAVLAALANYQFDLEGEGRNFLLAEAKNNDFFLLGELHGDNEIPALLGKLWPEMWKQGYRHIAAEVSPWAAYELELVPAGKAHEIQSLWTKQEATQVHALADPNTNVLWGCDIEEVQPEFLIRELAALNPDDQSFKRMVSMTNDGYRREMAPVLLDLALGSKANRDESLNDVSLRESLLSTLEIEENRLSPETKMVAQNKRELLMKQQFLTHLRRASASGTPQKVLLRFGRNHLHRGYDVRGISTLGNFVVELAIVQGRKAFNVGAFGAGGKATLLGETFDADESRNEPAFALLGEKAKYSATLFDLRPIRPLLHRISQQKRSALESNLIYWADSYDALICYKSVTPLKP
ncbi:MAG TPA: hypothetical protein VI488_17620 [Candidatus Angelobacter sp.]